MFGDYKQKLVVSDRGAAFPNLDMEVASASPRNSKVAEMIQAARLLV